MKLIQTAVLFLCPLVAEVATAATLTLSPVSNVAAPGSNLTIFVDIAGVTDLFAYQFDVAFDPAVLAAGTPVEGPFLSGAGLTIFSPGTVDNPAGQITFVLASLLGAGPGASGSGVLVELPFTVLGSGESQVRLDNILLLKSNLDSLEATAMEASVQIVPEPHTALLLIVGGLLCVSARVRESWRTRSQVRR